MKSKKTAPAAPERQKSIPRAYSSGFEQYFPSVNRKLRYEGMNLMVDTAAILPGRVTLKHLFRPHDVIQNPYRDSDLKRFEAAARRNWAVKSAIMVREHFVFGKSSELKLELNPKDAEELDKERQEEELKNNAQWQRALRNIDALDKRLQFIAHMKTFYWQALIFGRAAIVKLFDNNSVTSLLPINSRRLGDPIIGSANYELEGVMVDGQPLSKDSLIYSPYNDIQISPHTEYFGYSALETVAHVAEGLNVMVEEDIKEIMKSAWLASIMLQIDTSGLNPEQGAAKVRNVIDSIRAGKFIGFNEAVTATPLDLKPNYGGIIDIIGKSEQIVYKALHVPQFLVQNEGIANRATAIASAQLFLDGVIAADQAWLTAILAKQWYETLLRKELGLGEEEDPPVRIKRVFNQAKISEFVDLADSLIALVNGGVWDVQKANEVLGSEEVTTRVLKAKSERTKEQLAMANYRPDSERAQAELEASQQKARLMKNLADVSADMMSGGP